MENETLIPIEKYAARQRKSIYSIMQLANRDALKAVVKEEDGKKKTYIVMSGDEPVRSEAKEETPKHEEVVDYKEAYEKLQKELEAMKAKLDAKDSG